MSFFSSKCLREQDIDRLVDGDLPETGACSMRAHLETCSPCRHAVEKTEAIKNGLSRLSSVDSFDEDAVSLGKILERMQTANEWEKRSQRHQRMQPSKVRLWRWPQLGMAVSLMLMVGVYTLSKERVPLLIAAIEKRDVSSKKKDDLRNIVSEQHVAQSEWQKDAARLARKAPFWVTARFWDGGDALSPDDEENRKKMSPPPWLSLSSSAPITTEDMVLPSARDFLLRRKAIRNLVAEANHASDTQGALAW